MAGSFHSKLAGVSMANADGTSRQDYIRAFARAGMPIHLVREPDNPYDRNAVAAWITCRTLWVFKADKQIGYLPEHVARDIGPLLDAGRPVSVSISEVTGGEHKTFGVNILVVKD